MPWMTNPYPLKTFCPKTGCFTPWISDLKRSCRLRIAPLHAKGGAGWWLLPEPKRAQHRRGGKCPMGRGEPQI